MATKPTLNDICAVPSGCATADRNGAILRAARHIGLPLIQGALSDTNHPFYSATRTGEIRDGSRPNVPYTDTLRLLWFPITDVTSITDFEDNDLGYVKDTDYRIEDNPTLGIWYGTLRMLSGHWNAGYANLKVTYIAGLDDGTKVPASLSEAIRIITLDLKSNILGVRSKSVGSISVTYDRNEAYSIPRIAAELLKPFCPYLAT